MTGCWIVTGLFVATSWLLPALRYTELPDPFPIHWNARGEIDGWCPKPWGPFALPAIATLVQLQFAWQWSRFGGGPVDALTVRLMTATQAGLAGLLLYLTHVVLEAATGRPVRMLRHALGGVAVFVALLLAAALPGR